MFDDSVDLVVWGHEHDCRIVPEPVGGKKYYITQPGSSIATSLADGEAIEKWVFPNANYTALTWVQTRSPASNSRERIQNDTPTPSYGAAVRD